MSQSIQSGSLNLHSLDQLGESIETRLSAVYHDPHTTADSRAALAASWELIRQILGLNKQVMAVLVGAQAAMAELERQRDIAIHEGRQWREHARETVVREMAGRLAVDAGLPLDYATSVLELILGVRIIADETELERFYQALMQAARVTYSEEAYDAAQGGPGND